MVNNAKFSVDEASLRYQSTTKLAELADQIAATRSLNNSNEKTLQATKIRLWLKALDLKKYLTREQRERIWYALIQLSDVYDFPVAPVLSSVPRPAILLGNEYPNLINALANKVDRPGDTMTGDLGFSNAGINPTNYVQFNTAYNNGVIEGRMQWNNDDGTLEIGLPGSNITADLIANHEKVVNKTGSTLLRGKVVYINGNQGNRPTVTYSTNNTEAGSSKTFGILEENINNNGSGYVITAGLLRNINTSAYTAGQTLYLGTNGDITGTKPTAPAHMVALGKVIDVGNNGSIYVIIQNGFEIAELHDVKITSPTNGQVIKYDSATNLWINSSDTAGTGTVTNVGVSVPTGFVVSNSPVTTSGTIGITFDTGYSLPTSANQANWNSAYNDKITSAAVSGTTTKTLTLTQQDGGTITASWSDFDTAPVTSVFGRTGAVVAQNGDYTTTQVTEGTNLYFTDLRARQAISLTTNNSSGAATYSSTTGVLNVPNYTLSGLGGVPSTRQLTINGTAYDLSADRSWSVGTVTSVDLTAGTGMSVSGGPITGSGSITVTNTAPDQIVALTAGTGISTSGTYPNFTITNTAPDQTVSIAQSTGISVTGTYPNFTIANTAPDQTVVLTQGGTTTITGTYPNFTISSADQYTGTVTSVGLTVPTGFSVSNSPITTSGNIGLGFASGYSLPTTASQTNWDTAYSWGNHALAGYLTTETDPTVPSHVKAITTTQISNWDTAYGWGNHALAGYQLTSQKGIANGYASLDGAGKVPISQLPSSIMEYKGVWNASTNTPSLIDGTGDNGDVYRVSVAGTQNLGSGAISFEIGDYVIYNGATWEKSDTTDAVASVNGLTGVVTLTTSNIGEGTNLYFTNARARQAISLTTTGTSGAATYDNGTGVLNIPQYQSVLTNPVTGTGTQNYIPKWNNAGGTTLGNSLIYDNGTTVGINYTGTSSTLTVGGTFRNQLGSGVGGDTLLSVINGVSNGYQINVDTSNNIRYIWHTGANFQAMYLHPSGNLSVGNSVDSGYKLDVSGSGRTGTLTINTNGQGRTISTYYGANSDGSNIFIGGGGLSSIGVVGETYKGGYNSAVGVSALYSNTTGYSNSALGFQALLSNTTGTNNSAIGVNALYYNTTGYFNSALGVQALYSNTTGYNNSALGFYALFSNTEGNSNTALGFQAGYGSGTNANTTGTNNIFIGYQSVGVSATESNRTWIGNSSTVTSWIGGNLLLGSTTTTGERLQVTGNVKVNSGNISIAYNSASVDAFDILNSRSGGRRWFFGDGSGTTAGTFGFYDATASGLRFSIDPSGYVTINQIPNATTDTDRFLVSDSGVIKYRTGSEILSDIGAQAALTNPVTGTGASGQVAFFNGTSSITGESNLFWDSANDRLGIGTATPGYTLQVKTSDASVTVSSSDGTAEMRMNAQSGLAILETITNTDLRIRTNSVEKMRITSGGNVGIGTTNPAYTLDVQKSVGGDLGRFTWVGGTKSPNLGLLVNSDSLVYYSAINSDNTVNLGFLVNGSEVARFSPTGNLLVGTTTDAGYKLDINGTGRFSGDGLFNSNLTSIGILTVGSLSAGSDATINLATNASGNPRAIIYRSATAAIDITNTAGSSVLQLTNGGNLGLGVTPSAWQSIWKPIELQYGAVFAGLSGGYTVLRQNAYTNSSGVDTYISNGYANDYYQYAGQHVWRTAPSGTAGNPISFTQAMTLASTGNLLVGTTTDSGQKLVVSGSTYISSGSLYLANSLTTRTSQIEFANSSSGDLLGMPNNTSTFYLSYGTGLIKFRNDNGGDILSMSSSGASTFSSSVTASSFVKSGGTSTQYLMADGSTSTLTNPVTGTGTTNYIPKWTSASALGNSLVYDDGTNVGIGTISPSAKLDTRLSTNTDALQSIARLGANNLSGQLKVLDIQYTGSSNLITLRTNAVGIDPNIVFNVGTTEVFRTSGGNLLVGTTTDSGSKLVINGSALFGNVTSGYYVTPSQVHIGGTGTAQLSFEDVGVSTAAIALDGDNMSFGHQSANIVYRFKHSNTYNGNYATSGTTFAELGATSSYILSRLNIGTSTDAGYALNVSGNSYFTGDLNLQYAYPRINFYDTDNNSDYSLINSNGDFSVYDITNNAHRIYVKDTGLVGINTTTPAYTLDVNGTTRSTTFISEGATGTTGLLITSNTTIGTGSVIRVNKVAASNQAYMSFDSDQLYFGIPSNDSTVGYIGTKGGVSLGLQTAYNTRLFIAPTGEVGIGTTAPAQKLHVAFDSYNFRLSNTANTYGYNMGRNTSDGLLYLYGDQTNFTGYVFTGVDGERMRISSTGAVKFNQYGSGAFTGTAAYNLAVDASGNIIETAGGVVDGSGTANYISKWSDPNTLTNSTLIYDNGTNIGINTSSPQSQITLDLRSTLDVGIAAYNYNGTSGVGIQGYGYATSGTGPSYGIYGIAAGPRAGGTNIGGYFTASSAANNYALLTEAGNVGIGTLTPAYKLTVQGNAYINETLYVNGATTIEDTFTVKTADGSYNVATIDYSGMAGGRIKLFVDGTLRSQIGGYFGDNTFFNVGYGGSVGVGTSSPSTSLHVYSSTSDTGAGRTTPIDVLTLETENTAALEYTGFGQGIVFRGSTYNNTTQRTLGRILHQINDDSINTTRGTSLAFQTLDDATTTNAPTTKLLINYAGNVGIGTNDPQKKLHVYTTLNEGIYLEGATGGVWMDMKSAAGNIWSVGAQNNGMGIYNRTSSTYKFFITDAGLTGIGTSAPSYTLDVNGITRFQNIVRFVNNQWNVSDDGFNRFYFGAAGRTYFGSANGYEWRNVSDVGIAALLDDGNFGIGTLNAATRLHLYKSSVAADTDFLRMEMPSWGSSTNYLKNITWHDSGSNVGAIGMDYDGSMTNMYFHSFYNGGPTTNKLVTIKGNGNVGIGTTSPGAKLHIGESGAAAQLWLQRTDGYNPVKLIGGTLADGNGFKITMNTTDAFAITSGGNVGIGTTSPSFKLQVSGSISTASGIENVSRIDGGSTVASGGINFISYSTDYVRIAGLQSQDRDGNNRALVLNPSGGNLLVGTTTDSGYKLSVDGSGKFNGRLINTTNVYSTGDAGIAISSGDRLGFDESGVRSWSIKATSGALNLYSGDGLGTFAIGMAASITGATTLNNDLNLSYAYPRINLTNTGSDPDYSIINDNGVFSIYDVTNIAHRLRITSSGNILLGTVTDNGQKLQVNGDALINGITVGRGAGNISNNVVIGNQALYSNTTGDVTIAIGQYAGFANTTGYGGIYIGYNSSGSSNANFNTSIGYSSLASNVSGTANTVLGSNALYSTTGSNNVAIGADAGQTAYSSGTANTSGSNNIFIGYRSIGVSATESNRTWIGNTATETSWIAGNLLLGSTTTTGERLQVTGTSKFIYSGVNTTFDSGSANDARLEFKRNGTRIGYLNWDSGVINLQADSGNYLTLNAGGSERVRIDTSGNLGLGVTPSAWRNIFNAIQIGYTGAVYGLTVSNATEQINLASNIYQDSAGNEVRIQAGYVTKYQQGSGEHRWYNAGTSTAGSGISFTQAMTLASTGNLLVGTTTDSGERLQVTGTSKFTDQVKIIGGNTDVLNFKFSSSYGNTNIGVLFDSGSDAGNSLSLKVNNASGTATERLVLIGNGQLKLNSYTSTTSFTGTAAGVLAFDSSGNILSAAVPSSGIGGSTGSTDNAILRADGTGGNTLQASSIILDDSANLILGTTSLAGGTREITVQGSSTNINAELSAKGNGDVTLSTSALASAGSGVNLYARIGQVLAYSSLLASNAVKYSLKVQSGAFSSYAAGLGVGIELSSQTGSLSYITGSTIESVSTDITSSSEDFDLLFKTMSAGAAASERFRIKSTGQLKASAYTSSSSFSGTAAGYLAFTSSGDIITTTTPASGVAGSGTVNYVPKFTSNSTTLGDSSITDDGTTVSLLQGQLKFPASINSSTNANTLDDYEEGTFTPSLSASGSTFSYNVRYGTYTKIGRACTINIYFQLNTTGNTLLGNALTITGLPFSALNVTGNGDAHVHVFWSNISQTMVNMMGIITQAQTSINMYKVTSATTSPAIMNANDLSTTGGSQLRITFTYTTA